MQALRMNLRTAQLARRAHLSGKGDQINFRARWYQYGERQRNL